MGQNGDPCGDLNNEVSRGRGCFCWGAVEPAPPAQRSGVHTNDPDTTHRNMNATPTLLYDQLLLIR